MIIFFLLIILSTAGIAFVLWALQKNPEEKTIALEPIDNKVSENPDKLPVEGSSQEINSLLNKFNFSFKSKKQKLSLENELPALAPQKNNPSPKSSAMGTASLKTSPADESDPLAENNLKENFEQLEKLLKEKNAALENSERALNNELKNRQDFEKLKTLLETELLDTRQKAKKAQEELTSTSQESQEYKEKLLLLKEKADQLEQKISEKEIDVNVLLKRLEENQKDSLTKPVLLKKSTQNTTIEETEATEVNLTQNEEKPLEILPQEPTKEEDQEDIQPKIHEKDHKKDFFKFYDESVEEPNTLTTSESSDEKAELTNEQVKEIFPEDGFLKLKPDIIDDEGKIL